MKKYLFIIGVDEYCGAGTITECFKNFAKSKNIDTLSFSYIKSLKQKEFLDYNFLQVSKFYKFLYYTKIFFIIITKSNQLKAVYLQESAGLGKIYDIFIMLICTLNKKICFYHNHSSGKYIRYDFFSKIIQKISKYKVRHIFLSQKEALKFVNLYGDLGKHYCISNSIFITKNKNHKKINKLSNKFSFGLLSNLSKEKGLDQFLKIAQYALKKNKLWEFYLAGPITFRQKHYLNQISKLSNTTYLGPIYDVKKKSLFYRNIDFFLFLSSYFHESEPLVILEAISNGSIPIVFDRGSISDLVFSKELIIDANANTFLSVNNIVKNIKNKNELNELSLKSFKKYQKIRAKSYSQLNRLIKDIRSLNS